jgi:hypothetical protein
MASGIIFPMRVVDRFRSQLRASWKWALSFRTRDWELGDYPISVRRIDPDPNREYDENPRFQQHAYAASIINWSVSGSGNSKDEALKDLLNWFAIRKARLAEEGKRLPRPGRKVPLQFASQEGVNAHPDLTQDFIERVLGFEWAFVSDESSLWDFHTEKTNELLVGEIRSVYGVSVDDIESAKIWEILDRIAKTQKSE